MNDADIVKALECCKDSANFQKCAECPYSKDAIGVDCLDKIIADAFDLIKRQKAEIESMRKAMDNECDSCACELLDQRDRAKTEAIKEFAKRLKEQGHIQLPPVGYTIDTSDFVIYPEDIDILLKEMVNYG